MASALLAAPCLSARSATWLTSERHVSRSCRVSSPSGSQRARFVGFKVSCHAAVRERVADSFVVIPTELPRGGLPKGLIHFLGGAFIGATPDVTYSYLIDRLADDGYLVVATPYNVTFDHLDCAATIQSRFATCRERLLGGALTFGGWNGPELADLPVYGVGHSNGALMHVLMGCLFDKESLPSANVLISYNNKPASEAVPFFDQIGPFFKQAAPAIEAFPLTGIALSFAEQALQELERANLPLPRGIAPEDLEPLSRFADQIAPVFGQVREGVSEFRPTPSENRRNIALSYSVPKNLLVKYSADSIDETDPLRALLELRAAAQFNGAVELRELNGNHATPLTPDIRFHAGQVYSPLDALRQTVRSAALADVRATAKAITEWLDGL